MFQRIEEEVSQVYEVEIVSRSPWIVLFHNFLTDEESNAFVQTVEGTWERSTDTGEANEF
jgi:hypothetical protein